MRKTFFHFAAALSCSALVACPGPATNNDAGPDVVSPTDTFVQTDMPTADQPSVDVNTDMPTATTDTPDVVLIADASDAMAPGCPTTRVLVSTSDSAEGAFANGTITPRAITYLPPPMGVSVEQDHVVRRAGCRVYDLRRAFGAVGNQLVEVNAANPYTAVRTLNIPAVGPMMAQQNANPYDVAEVSATKSFLVLYNAPTIWVFNPTTTTMSGTVDITPFADADGIPESAFIRVSNGRAYVGLQLLNRPMMYAPPANSAVLVLDANSNAPVDLDPMTMGVQATIRLGYGNPQYASLTPDGRYLVVASTGGFGSETDGGVDVIDTTTNRVVATVSSMMLTADATGVVAVNNTTAWVAVHSGFGMAARTRVRELTLATGALNAMDPTMSTATLGDLQVDPTGTVWAIEGAFGAPGRVFAFPPMNAAPVVFSLPVRADAGATGTYSLALAP